MIEDCVDFLGAIKHVYGFASRASWNVMKRSGRVSETGFKKIANVPNLYSREATGVYYALVKRRRRRFRRSLRTTDFALAKRRLRDFEAKAGRLTGDPSDRLLTFDDVAERWLAAIRGDLKASTHERRCGAVKALTPFFRGEPVVRIGNRQIERWKIERAARVSAQTANIEAETLRLILQYAIDELRILIDNPAISIKRRPLRTAERTIPSKEAFRSLIAELRFGHKSTGEAADFVEFLAYSGTRKAEAAAVRWADINFDLGLITITGGATGTKNYRHRAIPLFPALARLLQEMRQRKSGVEKKSRIFGISSAHLQIQRACTRLGLQRFSHHSMRHFFCSNCIEAGVDFLTLSRWLGHSDGGFSSARLTGTSDKSTAWRWQSESRSM